MGLYDNPENVLDRKSYSFLWGLGLPAYVTTNFDPLLYTRAVADGDEWYAYPELRTSSLGSNQRTLYHIHGLAADNNSRLVFSQSEFDEAYNDPGTVRTFLETLFTEHNILFLGCALQEPALAHVFDRADSMLHLLEESHERFEPRRRVLLKAVPIEEREDETGKSHQIDNDKKQDLEAYLGELGVEVIWYRAERQAIRHEIEQILRKVCQYRDLTADG